MIAAGGNASFYPIYEVIPPCVWILLEAACYITIYHLVACIVSQYCTIHHQHHPHQKKMFDVQGSLLLDSDGQDSLSRAYVSIDVCLQLWPTVS